MRDCMKLLISSFLDNILYKCRMHVFLKHSWLMQLNGAIILHVSAGCLQKGQCSVKCDNHLVTYNLPLI